MENLGDIDVQSIAGATATGTHGTGRNLQNLSAALHSIELVLADGSRVEVNEERRVGGHATKRALDARNQEPDIVVETIRVRAAAHLFDGVLLSFEARASTRARTGGAVSEPRERDGTARPADQPARAGARG